MLVTTRWIVVFWPSEYARKLIYFCGSRMLTVFPGKTLNEGVTVLV